MKEVEKKDVPEISGGQSLVNSTPPFVPAPYPVDFPPNPGASIGPIDPIGPFGPINPIDPLGDAVNTSKL